MRKFVWRLAFLLPLISSFSFASDQSGAAKVSGRWSVKIDLYGSPIYFTLELTEQNGKLAGKFGGDKFEGTINGNTVHFLAKDEHGGTSEVTASLAAATQLDQPQTLAGSVTFTDPDDKQHPHTHAIVARMALERRAGPPERHEFAPAKFYRQFSPIYEPVLTVWPGDTIHTTTVDAGGTDEKGVTRVLGGNPETGPFYVETAMPGDTLVVHITHLRLNRDYAESDDGIVDRALTSDLAVKTKDNHSGVRWHLDRERGVATPDKPGDGLKGYSVPLRPMLGCVATAPGPAGAPPNTGDSGGWGGNMDFNEIVEGATVYLPVSNPGALLYVGDGHALQGDGELNGNALETSMDVELSVDVIPGKRATGPRLESSTHIMAMGLAGSLDDAFRRATENMAGWLSDTYSLTPSEIAQVLGTSAEYKISEVADRNAGVVLKINKERLKGLKTK